jgi:hypothetical protein
MVISVDDVREVGLHESDFAYDFFFLFPLNDLSYLQLF